MPRPCRRKPPVQARAPVLSSISPPLITVIPPFKSPVAARRTRERLPGRREGDYAEPDRTAPRPGLFCRAPVAPGRDDVPPARSLRNPLSASASGPPPRPCFPRVSSPMAK